MKLKLLIISLAAVAFFSCEESLDTVGLGIQPDVDDINVFTDTVYLDATTVRLDSIYAKTINGMIGQYYDPVFGTLRAGYVCQFYAPKENVFPDSIIDNQIDSVTLNIYYITSIGDSLTPMEVTVYPVVKSLKPNYYTSADPAQFCDLNTVLGRKTYTTRDLTISDSLYSRITYKSIQIKLPILIGVKFFEEYRKPQPNAFSSLESFTEFFKGIYIKPTYGVGNLINVFGTDVFVHYRMTYTKKDVNGFDSTYIAPARSFFNVTKEVIQLNHYKSANDDELLEPNVEKTFIKTPAGIFTKIIIPIPEIIKKIGTKKFSNANLSLTAIEQDAWQYALKYPKTMNDELILINKDSVNTFFENQLLASNFLIYYRTQLMGSVCNFGNISSVIQDAITKAPDRNLELLVMPVSNLTTSSGQPYASSNYLELSGISFKKSAEFLKLQILATDIDLNK